MYHKIIIIFLLLINFKLRAQNIDSIFKAKKEFISSFETDSEKAAYLKEVVSSIKTDSKKAAYLFKCGEYFYFKNIVKSEYFYAQALLFSENKKNIMEGKSLWKLGLLERKKGDLGKSLRLLSQAKKIFKDKKEDYKYASIHFDIGLLYRYKNQTNKEIEFYKKGAKLVRGKDEKLIGKSYLHFGNYYTRNRKLDSSIYYYNKALNLFKKINNEKRINNVYNNIANTYYKKGDYKKVINIRNLVLKYAKANQNQMLLTVNYHNIAAAYSKIKKNNLANTYLDSAIFIAKKENFKRRIAKSYNSKSKLNFSGLQNYKEAYESHKLYKIYSDSIFKSQLTNRINELEINKNLQLENQKQIYQKKLYLSIFSILFLLCLLIIFLIHKNSVDKSNHIKKKLNTEKTQKQVLSKKFKTSETEIKKLVADNSMRSEFLKQFLKQLKANKKTAESFEAKNYIKDLIFKIQQQISTEEKLTLLKEKINQINDGFDNKLIANYNKLSKTEREVCSLLRLNLSIKEIAAIRNSNPNAIKAIRYRIRKKMNIPKDQKLEVFIQKM